MVPSPSTRDMLLDAATRLFAERGIDNVSVAEMVRAAGQRNASAVQYHIGNRDDVLFAVLARHVPAIADRRHQLLERARSTPARDIRPAAEAIVRPVTLPVESGLLYKAWVEAKRAYVDRISGGKLGYVHLRNVRGKVPAYKETFIDDGDVDIVRVLRILKKNNYSGVLIPDHAPQMSCAAPWHAGMAYALGFMRGALKIIEDETGG